MTKTVERQTDESAPGARRAALIEARDVFKIYKQGRAETVALRGASLTVDRGEFVCIVGPSGSGKSTLMSILTGLASPSAGSVVIDGQDLADLDEAGLARWRSDHVGIVFQRGNLFPFLSAAENVRMIARRRVGPIAARRRARELLATFGLADRARHRPARLSGGEVQRVSIAAALANHPTVLFGDEVTGELDSATADEVMSTLASLRRDTGITVVMVTHNPEIAAQADRTFEVAGGLVAQR